MFGTPFRSLRRPVLLIVVFGFFLMIVGLTALSQAIIVSSQSSQTMLTAVVGSDAATVRGFANAYLVPADLEPGGLSATRAAALRAQVRTIVSAGQILRIELRLPDGTVLLSDTGDLGGVRGAPTPDFTRRGGRDGHGRVPPGRRCRVRRRHPARERHPPRVLPGQGQRARSSRSWGSGETPRRSSATSIAFVEQVMLVTLFAGALAAVALYLVFRAAQGRILRQTDQLLEATRLDQMTGTLNHGALVGVLAVAIEAARKADETLGIALLDIDNFRNLNETYGHPAGDQALTAVATLLRDVLPAGDQWGRYGPDEFLVIVAAGRDDRPGTDDRARPDATRRPQPAVRVLGAPADHDQRRDLHVPDQRRVGDDAPVDRVADARRGQGQRRRQRPRRTGRERVRSRRRSGSTSSRG